ncbi:MAG TPA: MinD/ParA family protein, partial [Candidatus Angelobacter sp.]|nr:MinD/ParA family protein [Candidatus Angelobacter sp.]
AEDEDNSEDQGNGGDPQDVAAQPPAPPQTQPQPQPENQQPKTPDQLLQELQEMKKQQEQQQQGVTPNPAQVPRKTPPLN